MNDLMMTSRIAPDMDGPKVDTLPLACEDIDAGEDSDPRRQASCLQVTRFHPERFGLNGIAHFKGLGQ